jgi:hypothetical protein
MSKYQICDGEDGKCFNSVKPGDLTSDDHKINSYTPLLASGGPVAHLTLQA